MPTKVQDNQKKLVRSMQANKREREASIELLRRKAYSNPYFFAKVLDIDRPKPIYNKEREAVFKEFMVDIGKYVIKEEDVTDNDGNIVPQHRAYNLATFPRLGKSMSCAILIGWLLGRNPNLRIVYVTASEELAKQLLNYVKNVINSPKFSWVFPDIEIERDNANEIYVRQKGSNVVQRSIYAAGIFGQLTGIGADIMFCDDLYKSHTDALSPAINKRVIETYYSAVRSRLDGVKKLEVHIGTRWHNEELFALLEKEDYYEKAIKVKAFDEENQKSLYPSIITTKELKTIKKNDPFIFNSMYQQEYAILQKRLFKQGDFQEIDTLPNGIGIIVIDTAGDGDDFTNANYYIYDGSGYLYWVQCLFTQQSYDVWLRGLNAMINHYNPTAVFIEDNKDPYLVRDIKKRFMNEKTHVIPFTIPGNAGHKHARVISTSYAIKSKILLYRPNVYTFDREEDNMFEECLKQIYSFIPWTSKHDDAVDNLANTINQIHKYEELLNSLVKRGA